MKKILITGSTGMLGTDLVRLFSADSQYDVYGLSRSKNSMLASSKQIIMDLALPFEPADFEVSPDVIIHTAALTDLGLCERQPELADQIHVRATRLLQTVLKKGRFFYISTDSVFDGLTGNYSENDLPNPLNVYAQTKLKGEQVILSKTENIHSTIRTNIYGFHMPFKNSLIEWAIREWKEGKKISGFSDTIFNAVYTADLARIIKFLIDENINCPLLNIGSNRAISKFDFLELLRRQLNIDPALLFANSSDDFVSTIRRPKNTSLNVDLLSSFYMPPTFENGIEECVADINAALHSSG
jgi:dTDP-4-dehydrorhamnose reductase